MILFENAHILGLNKPRFAHSTGVGIDTLHDTISRLCPEALFSSPSPEDSGLVNRLDFETSGVVVVAKSPDSWMDWHKAFIGGEIQKEYLALVEGAPVSPRTISNFIGSRYRGSKRVTVSESPKARYLRAESYLEPVKVDDRNRFSLVRVTTSTGRRHQVRAHCAHLGHTLVGDFLYGANCELLRGLGVEQLDGGSSGFFLHASTLTRGDIIIEAPLVAQFKDLVMRLFTLSSTEECR
jgi:23S rRNA-/tRNA-specific pseudouridylate synthase